MLPNVPRILCLYHITENVKRHCSTLLGDQYGDFHRAWRNLADRLLHQDEFEPTWQKLMSDYPAVEVYFSKVLHPTRTRWCQVFTKSFTTFGARTTQRVESVNRVIKHFLERNTTLERLVTTVAEVADGWAAANIDRVKESRLTNHSATGAVYTEAVKTLTREAAEHVYSEGVNALDYRVVRFQSPPAGCSASLNTPSSTRVN